MPSDLVSFDLIWCHLISSSSAILCSCVYTGIGKKAQGTHTTSTSRERIYKPSGRGAPKK